ncbi:MAG: hypothetical protein KIS85_10065 [Anaerolineales bacterium]|nr:hypothetical protein [Anaerolineales bacterium]
MAKLFENRRNRILAVLLALIAAGSLCVMAVSAAGYTLSSPAWEALISFFRSRGGPTTGGPQLVSPVDPTGPGDDDDNGDNGGGGNGGNNGGGNGGGNGNQTCLLDLLCIRADVDVSTSGSGSGSGNRSGGCFLNLLCLSADVEVGGSGSSTPLIQADADLDDRGPDVDVDVAGGQVVDINPNLNLNNLTDSLLPNLLGGGSDSSGGGNGCLLGILCLNLGGN